MKTFRLLMCLVAVVALVLTHQEAGRVAASVGPDCQGPITFQGEINPPAGVAVLRVLRIDANCRTVTTPDRLLSEAEALALVSSPGGIGQASERVPSPTRQSLQKLRGFASPTAMVAGGPIHMFNRVKDAVGLNVTSIDPHNFSYGYNGSYITSTTHDATVNRAVDQDPNQCGHGWDVVWPNTSITISGGGVGYTFADSLTHAEFSYLGRFDCSGTVYYNILDTKLTGFGNGGSSTCAYRTQLRNTFYGWYQELLCWDAYGWTIPPVF